MNPNSSQSPNTTINTSEPSSKKSSSSVRLTSRHASKPLNAAEMGGRKEWQVGHMPEINKQMVRETMNSRLPEGAKEFGQ